MLLNWFTRKCCAGLVVGSGEELEQFDVGKDQGPVWMIQGKFISKYMFYAYHLPLIVLSCKGVWIRGKYGWDNVQCLVGN